MTGNSESGCREKTLSGVNRSTLPSWTIQRKYFLIFSLGDCLEDWLREKQQQQKYKIIDYGIYSRYQVSKLFTDLPRTNLTSSYEHMGKWNNDLKREEKMPHCNELVNKTRNRPSPAVHIPVPNDHYKLRYKHRPSQE